MAQFNNTSLDNSWTTNTGLSIVDLFLLPAYCLVISIGLGGNALVITVVKRKRSLHTTTNYFLANLAVADLLNLIWCIPGLVLTFVEHPRGALGDFLCKFVTMHHIAGIMQIVSGLTLTVLAVERYNALFRPMDTRFRLQKKNIRYALAVMWVFSILYVVPLFVYEKFSEVDKNCSVIWPNWQTTGPIYWGVLAVIVLLCFMTMIFCYFNIIKGLYFSKTICARGPTNAKAHAEESASKRKIVKLLLSITLAFCICFIPFIIASVVFDDGSRNIAYKLTYFLVYCSSSLNPLIYAYYSSNYRNAFNEVFMMYSERVKWFESRVPRFSSRFSRHCSSFEMHSMIDRNSLHQNNGPRLLSFKRL